MPLQWDARPGHIRACKAIPRCKNVDCWGSTRLNLSHELDSTGNLSMAERQDLHLQGVEEFIRDFRIKHDM